MGSLKWLFFFSGASCPWITMWFSGMIISNYLKQKQKRADTSWNGILEIDMRVSCSLIAYLSVLFELISLYFVLLKAQHSTLVFFFLPKMYQWCNCKNGLDVRSDVGSWVCVGGRHCWYPILSSTTSCSFSARAGSFLREHPWLCLRPLSGFCPCLGQVQYSRQLAPWEQLSARISEAGKSKS